ncbi:MAG: hypothetical protein E4H09_03875, partial [Spirochaetales bacterium]
MSKGEKGVGVGTLVAESGSAESGVYLPPEVHPVKARSIRNTALALTTIVVLASCSSTPTGADGDADTPDRVSYILDTGFVDQIPGLSATVVSGNVDVRMDWDTAHNQFLEELNYSGIFTSVVQEPETLVDYGARFSLSELPDGSMQVQLTFINMHTGDTVFTGVTRGNRRNGHFGFAYIEGTDTSYRDAANLQQALVQAIRNYQIQADDISGMSIAVLEPSIDSSRLPEDDEDVVNVFRSFVGDRFVLVVEDMLVNITNAGVVNRRDIDQAVASTELTPEGLFDQTKVGLIGQTLGADYVMMSKVVYDPDGYFLISLKLVDMRTESVFRSAVFEAELWSNETTAFDIGTNIDRMFHRALPPGQAAKATPPVAP